MWSHNSYLLFLSFSRIILKKNRFWRELWLGKVISWSEVNPEPYQTSMMQLKRLPILAKGFMFDKVLSTPLRITFAIYRERTSN